MSQSCELFSLGFASMTAVVELIGAHKSYGQQRKFS